MLLSRGRAAGRLNSGVRSCQRFSVTPRASKQIRYVGIAASITLVVWLTADFTPLQKPLQPFFLLPYVAAALADGNVHSPSTWLLGIAVFIQFYVIVVIGSWLVRLVRPSSKT